MPMPCANASSRPSKRSWPTAGTRRIRPREAGDRAGVRPSSGAATIDTPRTPESSETRLHVDVAAPGDGRTPGLPVSWRCALLIQDEHQTIAKPAFQSRSEEHTSEVQSPCNLVCRLLLEKKKTN